MAPAAMVDSEPMQLPVSSSKPSAISASVLHGPRDLRLEQRSIGDPGIGELQIAVKSTGICGSDVSYYKKFANGDLCACQPLSLGHESSGVVVAVGPQVSGFAVGDRVALEVGVACGQCGICRKGRYNLCKKMRFRSSAKSFPHFQGTLQERINHPAVWCHRLPEHISFDAAALLEPLSVAIHAVNRAAPAPGSTALVIGAGTVGLLTAAMARQSGCTAVTICDVDAGRVNYAISRGFATHGFVVPQPLHASPSSSSIYNPSSNSNSSTNYYSGTSTPADPGAMTPASMFSLASQLDGARGLANEILGLTRPELAGGGDDEDEGVDVAFECTGKESCMHTSLYATRPGGKVIMVGMGTPIQTLPMSVAHLREVDILGIFRYANTYPTGIRLLSAAAAARGRGPTPAVAAGFALPSLDDMVTHRFKGLESAKSAFELAGRTVDDEGKLVLKVVIEA
ncbi:Alcohol dehydrogenase GroES-like domain-containing protein [Pleurostoma richardsiae]|uniref:Alcohol dehydrogenase GroES-like domain-containing protein n=1 Tax=Pleurostoma richardsiae TaxID=41990 RepID=A0AA38REF8_9PEZI|nr:Alcohol dehydrogenase GroES-like domain-containing protein [Pleurostoma richardsiae]